MNNNKKRPPPIIIPNTESKDKIRVNNPTPHAPIIATNDYPKLHSSPEGCYDCLANSRNKYK